MGDNLKSEDSVGDDSYNSIAVLIRSVVDVACDISDTCIPSIG